jgi:hypothetical protein
MEHIDKILAELEILRGFIDFVNRQVGVYCDCLSSFQGNKVRIERQVARESRPKSGRIENGQTIIMRASLEDPARPDVIHQRIIRTDEFITANSEAQFNEQQVCWAIIVFVFAYWDEEIRPQIAKIRGVKPNDVKIDAFGDLRILRKNIVHNRGLLPAADHAKLKLISAVCQADTKISLTHDQMHTVFVAIKSAIGSLILEHTGHLPGTPEPKEIVDVAIQNTGRS